LSWRIRFLLGGCHSFICGRSRCLLSSWSRFSRFFLFNLFRFFLFIFLITWQVLVGKEVILIGLEKSSDVEGTTALDNERDLIEKRDEDIDCDLGISFGEIGNKEFVRILLDIK